MKTQNNNAGKYCKVMIKAKKFFSLVGCFLLLTLLLGLFQINQANAEDNFFIKKGNEFELCRELNQILNSEENKDYAVPYVRYSPFKIPKRFKNFDLPKWRDVPIENLSQYMKNTDEIFQTIKKDGNDFKKYKMQETKINYDNYGPEEVFIRLVTEDKFKFDIIINGGAGSYRIPHDNSYTYVSDINEEDTENLYNNTNSIPQAKFIFYYKGKIFYSVSSINHVLAIEPKLDKITKYKPGFYGEYVCFLNLTPKKSDIAHKKFVYDVDLERLKKEPNEGGKKMIESAEKEIKKLEEELKAYQKN